MTTAGPYRGRLDQPVSIDDLMREIQRRRRWQRALPVIIACSALSPALAIAVGARSQPQAASNIVEIARSIPAPARDPWGFVISADGVRPSRTKSDLAPRPNLTDSPYSADHIQAAVFDRASELRDCYVRSSAFRSQAEGALVASMLITRSGEVQSAVGGASELRRAGVGACVRGVLEELTFPASRLRLAGLPDYGWVHLPLRFEP